MNFKIIDDILLNMDPIPGNTPEQPQTPEQADIPEAIKPYFQDRYTVEGGDFIVEIKEAKESGDVDMLRDAAERAIGFMEGLQYGIEPEDYDIDSGDDVSLDELREMFEDIDSSVDRPQYGQVYLALRDALTISVREAKKYQKNPDAWQTKYATQRAQYWNSVSQQQKQQGQEGYSQEQIMTAVAQEVRLERGKLEKWADSAIEIRRLKNHMDARIAVFDPAFTHRQRYSIDAGGADKAANDPRNPKPNRGNWNALYRGNRLNGEQVNGVEMSQFGDAVSRVEKLIEADENLHIYIDGFKNSGEFKQWLKTLLEESKVDGKERLDVVWMAWRLSLWKERITKKAWRVSNEGKYQFAKQPFADDGSQKAMHSQKIFANEFGWKGVDSRGNVVDFDNGGFVHQPARHKTYKAVSHSGHPLTVGRFPSLMKDFMTHAEADGVSLEEYWSDRGISMAHPDFPWANTENRPAGEPGGEAGTAVGLWFLNRHRAQWALEQLKHIHEGRELTPTYFEELRNFEKLKLINPGNLSPDPHYGNKPSPDNAMAYFAASRVWYLVKLGQSDLDSRRNNPFLQGERGYRPIHTPGRIALGKSGEPSLDVTALGILDTIEDVGLVSKPEIDWIKQNILGVKV